MAVFGSLNNANSENTASDHRFTGGVMTSAGTLTELSVYMAGWVGGAKFRFAIYQGGAAGDPTGATLIWQSNEITDSSGSAGWRTMTGTYSQTVTGTLTAIRTWIRIKNNDGTTYLTNTDKGDWITGSELSGVANTPSVAFASTWETDAGSGSAEAIKAYITFTEAAGEGTAAPTVGASTLAGQAPTTQRIRQIAPVVGMIAMAALNPYISNNRPAPAVGAMTIAGLVPTVVQSVPPSAALAPSVLTIAGTTPTLLRYRTITPSLPSSSGDTGEDLIPTLVWGDTKFPGVGLAIIAGQIPALQLTAAGGAALLQPTMSSTPPVFVGQVPNIVQVNGNSTVLNALRLVMSIDGLVPFISGSGIATPGVGAVTMEGRLAITSSPTIWIDVQSPQAPTWTDI